MNLIRARPAMLEITVYIHDSSMVFGNILPTVFKKDARCLATHNPRESEKSNKSCYIKLLSIN